MKNWVKCGAKMPEETEGAYQALCQARSKKKNSRTSVVVLGEMRGEMEHSPGMFMEVFIFKRDGAKVRGYLFVAKNVLRVVHLHSGPMPETDEEHNFFHAVIPDVYGASPKRRSMALQMYDWYNMAWNVSFDMWSNSSTRPLNDLEEKLVGLTYPSISPKEGNKIVHFPHNIPVFDRD
jgi:hypothetical protein